MTERPAAAWRRGLAFAHRGRWLAFAAWWAVMITAVVAVGSPCSSLDPSLCGPTPAEGPTLGFLLAAPVLLLASPATGYAVAVIGAVLAAATVPSPGPLVFGLFAALCVGLLTQLLPLRRRQQRSLPATPSRAANLAAARIPTSDSATTATIPTPWRARAATAAALVAVAIGCLIGYDVSTSALAAHLARSTVVDAVVQATDPDASEITVQLPDTEARTLSVNDTGVYRVGEPVPLHLDTAVRPHWVALVAEPDDLTWWQSLAVIAALFAGLLIARPVRERHRRETRGDAVVRMELVRTGRHSDTTLFLPGDSEPLARLHVRITAEAPHDADGDGDADDEDDWEDWRDDEAHTPYTVGGNDDPWYGLDPRINDAWYDDGRFDPRDDPGVDHFDPDEDETPVHVAVLVSGEWYYGGVVTATTDDGNRIARGRLTVPRRQPSVDHTPVAEHGDAGKGWIRRAFRRLYSRDSQITEVAASPVERTMAQGEVRLPATFRAARRTQWFGAAMLAGGVLVAIATPTVVHAYLDAWEALWALTTGSGLWISGIAMLLGRLVVEDQDLRIFTTARERRVPWRLLAPVNELDDTVVLTWYPGTDHASSSVDQATDVPALLETLRQRAIKRGEPRTRVRTRWRATFLLAIAYPAAAALMWWSLYR